MQDLPRLHAASADGGSLSADAVLALEPGQAHYLGHVLRRTPGDEVELFNAVDGAWLSRIETLRKDRCSVRVERRLRAPAPEPGPTLLFAPVRRDATDLVVRMATELGVAGLQPVLTERTNIARVNAERWQAIATEAAEQCERLSVPEIAAPVRLYDLLGGWDPGRPLLAAIERGAVDTIAAWRARTAGREAMAARPGLLVGPEGGFSPAELERIRARPFVVPVTLGPRILRAETACMAGLACLL